MKASEQRAAAKRFAERWNGRGDEKSDTQLFWIELLQDVFGVEDISNFIIFEDRVKLEHTSFIDARIPSTKVLIEQKSITRSLTAPYKQSDGSLLTPYQQAKKYIVDMKLSQHPRWVVTCNFKEFYIYDMEKPTGDPLIIKLEDLQDEYYLLQILVEDKRGMQKKEMEVSLQAGELVGVLYEALLNQYADKENEESLKALNMLCVRLVFCLYAEDAGIFGKRRMFHDYLAQFEAKHLRKALIELFQVLDQKPEERNKYLEPELAQFPYVNGGLFENENIEIPMLTEEIKDLLLNRASLDFDWSAISPTIFGAVFESTLNPETRRSGGMHYTSIENIHKVIDPLFMDDLKQELEEIKATAVIKTKEKKLQQFQKKLSELVIFDPACGSGNFLTESYISLRRLENETLMDLLECNKKAFDTQIMLGVGELSPIQVNISQFYGIEINDFAVSVARTAMWIAESQMMEETAGIVHMDLDFLPLKSYNKIEEGNALRMDWEDVVPLKQLSYIIGNPPFVSQGGSSDRGQRKDGAGRSKEQAEDMKIVFGNEKGTGNLDYVSCWFRKAFELMKRNQDIETAFVSTNSICQGQQVSPLWKYMFEQGVKINFAHNSFFWDSEANNKAVVFVIVVGFSIKNKEKKTLFQYTKYKDMTLAKKVKHINAYLLEDAPDVFIDTRTKPLCGVSSMVRGGGASDWGYLMLSEEEKVDLVQQEPEAAKWVRPFLQGNEFIKGIPRYCLWMKGITPNDLKKMPLVRKRIEAVREQRLLSKKASTRKKAETPWLFDEIIKVDSDNYIAFPQVSGGNRKYIPIGYVSAECIAGNKLFMIPNGTIYEFGVLTSNVHNAWTRVVASHYGPSYQYSNNIAYNNFPWPNPTREQKERIEQTAKMILDARAKYPDASLADMYGEYMYMYPELLKAHQENDKAVMTAYGFYTVEDGKKHWLIEAETVAELMKMYLALTEKTK